MKTIKLLILFATISLFTTAPFNAAEARDCSDPKGFHQKLMCKKLLESLEFGKSSDNSAATDSSASTDDPKKKGSGLGGVWNAIKNFGGKKVGEPG